MLVSIALTAATDSLRDPELSLDTFKRQLKTYIFAKYWWQNVLSALEIFLSMRCINLRFTYLLTYLQYAWHKMSRRDTMAWDQDIEDFVRDETLGRLETVSRPRCLDRDHIPAIYYGWTEVCDEQAQDCESGWSWRNIQRDAEEIGRPRYERTAPNL